MPYEIALYGASTPYADLAYQLIASQECIIMVVKRAGVSSPGTSPPK